MTLNTIKEAQKYCKENDEALYLTENVDYIDYKNNQYEAVAVLYLDEESFFITDHYFINEDGNPEDTEERDNWTEEEIFNTFFPYEVE